MAESFYITTPIYYVNDVPHIGHAYTTVAADVAARYHRLKGDDVYFLTGVDEHGQKNARAAAERGMDPQAYVDSMVSEWQGLWPRLDISNDDFIRTTESRHKTRVQQFWSRLKETGDVYLGHYEGLYCIACEDFYKEMDLIGGNCPIHGTPVEMVSEENYFFRLSAQTDWLLNEYYARTPAPVQPAARLNEVAAFVRAGLQDVSISRTSFTWGIPVPWDPKHVTYVWVEALLNYITALEWPDGKAFKAFWPGVHMMAKDILRFHAVTWPAMLHAAGVDPPAQVFAHGWLLVGGEKMSKTKLTGIHPDQLVNEFGVDAYRYYFTREVAFGQDGSFSYESMLARYNAELANGIGNLASRVVAMITSYFDGAIPDAAPDASLSALVAQSAEEYMSAMDSLAFHQALEAVDKIVRRANGYIVETAPWVLAKDESQRDRLATVLWSSAELLRVIAILLTPFMPSACNRLATMLGLDESTFSLPVSWGGLEAGGTVTKGDALFPRLEQ